MRRSVVHYLCTFRLTTITLCSNLAHMIKSFRSKSLRRFAEKGDASKLPVQNSERVRRILARLDTVMVPADMDLPGWYFHSLSGDQKGRHSVRVTGNWRITFGWDGTDAIDVDIEDYH